MPIKYYYILSASLILFLQGSEAYGREKQANHQPLTEELMLEETSKSNRTFSNVSASRKCVFSECANNPKLKARVSTLLKSKTDDLSDKDVLLLKKLCVAASASAGENNTPNLEEFVSLYRQLHVFDDKGRSKEIERLARTLYPYMLKAGVEKGEDFYRSEFYKKFTRRVNYLNRK